MVSPPSTVSVCPSLALAGQVVWTQSYGPSCSSCVLSSRGVSGAAFCCLGLLSHPLLQWSSLDSSYSLVVQLLVFSWTLCWSSFLSLPVFADSSGWLSDIPWLSALRCLTAGGVALVFCQGHVSLPQWGCGASGFLGPAGLMVFATGSPVSGRACGLPWSSIVTKTFPPSGGFGS